MEDIVKRLMRRIAELENKVGFPYQIRLHTYGIPIAHKRHIIQYIGFYCANKKSY